MTLHSTISQLILPGDEPWMEAALARGIADLTPAEAPRFGRILAGLDVARLLGRVEACDDATGARLYEIWLEARGGEAGAWGAWFNLGITRMRLGQPGAAVEAYGRAVALKPDFHEAVINMGLALEADGRAEQAMAVWRSAIPGRAARRLLHLHLGRLLEDSRQPEAAAEELLDCLAIDPDQPDVIQHYVHLRQRMMDWPVTEAPGLALSAETLAFNCGPLAALALRDDPAFQTAVTRAWIARKIPAAPERLAPVGGYAHGRIRVGYISTDFCSHAMSYLIAEVLERHDRGAFEVYGYCASPEDGSPIRARVVAAFDHHVPIGALSDEAAARRIRADEIDVLVDLNGLTRGARLGVLRWKPAPVQVTYLGYIGPVPLPELDWMIADHVTIPDEMMAQYAPAPLRLEGCFQANDSREPDLPPVSRAEEGLPEGAFVFCSFSHHYKITPPLFAAWLRILAHCPGAVLWIVEDNPRSRSNIEARWRAAGLDPARLIFAARVDPMRYRARLALADLFLDTTPYNAGTVASDALRIGLPLITVRGRAFAARMAASLLTAVGLSDCVAEDLDDYVTRAVALATDKALHAEVKGRLAGEAWARSLGDCAGFTARLEAAYRRIRLG